MMLIGVIVVLDAERDDIGRETVTRPYSVLYAKIKDFRLIIEWAALNVYLLIKLAEEV